METQTAEKLTFKLPDLPYEYNALEPYIDEQTMRIHHTKHHGGYVEKFNNAIEHENIQANSIEEILQNLSKYSNAVRNNGGGHYNHSLFWTVMSPNAGGNPTGEIAEAINKSFGSFDNFKQEFENAAKTRFGSGWAWLVTDSAGQLKIGSTPNQDNPIMDVTELNGTPVLGLDVWEHAYYLKYQNKRPEYVTAFWNIINWNEVNKRYNNVKS